MPYKNPNSPEAKASAKRRKDKYNSKNRDKNAEYSRKYRETNAGYKANKSINDKAFAERNRQTTEVYYLPEEHYIGITHYVPARMSSHRYKGKITEGYEIIASFERHVDAAMLELMFHQRGYNGYKYDNYRITS